VPAIAFTCEQNLTIAVNGQMYSLPDQVDVRQISGSVASFSSWAAANEYEYQAQYSAYTDVDDSSWFGLASASLSASFAAFVDFVLAGGGQFTRITLCVSGWDVQIPMWDPDVLPPPPLSAVAKRVVEASILPVCQGPRLSDACTSAVAGWASHFGTHFFNASCQGGSAESVYMTGAAYVQAKGSQFTSLQVCYGLDWPTGPQQRPSPRSLLNGSLANCSRSVYFCTCLYVRVCVWCVYVGVCGVFGCDVRSRWPVLQQRAGRRCVGGCQFWFDHYHGRHRRSS
jgi:hypothetical protein